ncbi:MULTISPECIES: hypothetical protein [unclassified Streptomyces]|nr:MULTISPECIES: hypothetical protein [unclassified Streptomyces]
MTAGEAAGAVVVVRDAGVPCGGAAAPGLDAAVAGAWVAGA